MLNFRFLKVVLWLINLLFISIFFLALNFYQDPEIKNNDLKKPFEIVEWEETSTQKFLESLKNNGVSVQINPEDYRVKNIFE
ncbi:MAG TPA: hypothetical protein PLQ36_03030 [Candidatus Gracilibacteria bacterium]|nr:hypothetical protein [Candidatus Gracilibacteria bacterium]